MYITRKTSNGVLLLYLIVCEINVDKHFVWFYKRRVKRRIVIL